MLQSNPPALTTGQAAGSFGNSPGEEPTTLAPPILVQYWQVVLRWKWVIVGIVAAAIAIGLVLTLLATPQYTAASRIEISRDQKKVTSIEGLESQDAGRDLEFYQTQYSLLQARSLAERVSRQLRLSTKDDFFEAHGVSPDDNALFASKSGQPLSRRRRPLSSGSPGAGSRRTGTGPDR